MKISDTKLLEETKIVAKQEQMKTLELMNYLQEIEKRMAYVRLGYTSLYGYLTQELGYSGSEAALRVNAMRLVSKVPEVKNKIALGTLSLSSAASINCFVRSENVDVGKLVEECEHKTTREVVKILEEKRMVKKVEINLKLTGSAAEKFERLKKLYPDLGDVELIESVIEEKLMRVKLGENKVDDCERVNQRVDEVLGGLRRSAIPRKILRILFTRAQYQCEYVDPKDGGRCGERRNLQCDHKFPVAWGGTNGFANLRILCRAHNLAAAYVSLGVGKMSLARRS